MTELFPPNWPQHERTRGLVVQHHRAHNDPSGNPQRLWVVYDVSGDYARTVRVIDEGYGNMPADVRAMVELPSVDITKSRYHQLVRAARAAGTLEYAS